MAPLLFLVLLGVPTAEPDVTGDKPAPTASSAEPLADSAPAEAEEPAPPRVTKGGDQGADKTGPTTKAKVPRLALLDLEAQNIDEATAKIVNTLITSAISDIGQFELITMNDIRRAVSFEEQKQNAGCDDTSCLAEIADALGTQYLVYGELGKIGEQYVVHVDVYATEQGKTINRVNFRTRDLDELTERIDPSLRELLTPIAPRPIGSPTLPVERSATSVGLLYAGGAVGVAGAALAVMGAAVGGGTAVMLFQPSAPGVIKSVWWLWMVGAGGAALGTVAAAAGVGLYVGGHVVE